MPRVPVRIPHNGRALFGLLLVCAAAAGCDRERPAPPRERLTIALAMLPHASLVHLAIANRYPQDEGLDLTVQPHPFGKPALDSVLAGRADLATVADTPIVLAILNGKPVSVFATIESASRNTAVVALARAGIARPEDLAGKRIGWPFGTNADFFLDALLTRYEVAPESIRRVDLRPEELSDALASGKVDAVAIWNPYGVSIRKRLGDAVRVLYAGDLYTETFGLAGRPDSARRHEAAVERLLRALVRAEEFVRERPQEARRTVAAALSIEPSDLDAMWAPFDFRVKLDQGLLVLLDDEARWAMRTGLAPKQPMPNFLDAIADGPLRSARPDAVRLIR